MLAQSQKPLAVATDQVLGGEFHNPADRQAVEQYEPARGAQVERQRGLVQAAAKQVPPVLLGDRQIGFPWRLVRHLESHGDHSPACMSRLLASRLKSCGAV